MNFQENLWSWYVDTNQEQYELMVQTVQIVENLNKRSSTERSIHTVHAIAPSWNSS